MTIITQEGLVLNYRYIREIGIFDAEDKDKNYFCLISAKNEKGEDFNLAAYSTSDEGESAYNRLIAAFKSKAEVFSFEADEPIVLREHTDTAKSGSEKSSYKNRFIDKDR